jgi:hypothetical protein
MSTRLDGGSAPSEVEPGITWCNGIIAVAASSRSTTKCNAAFEHANITILDCLELILMMW